MNTPQRRIISLLLLSTFLVVHPFAAAQDRQPARLFSDSNEWKVTLTGPWRKIQSRSAKDARYPVQLTYPGADGAAITVDIEVAPRALTRRRICDFPPLKIHFDKKKMQGTALRGNKSLKLVTYCGINKKFEQYYIKEFLVYRIYNLITEYSYRVKPLMVDYQDSERDLKPVTRFGFLIEDTGKVADRNKLKELTTGSVRSAELDLIETSRYALFQYMIGNLDWAATGGSEKDKCCHNSRIIGTGVDEVPKYVIPYDFDSSGLVNTHYAAPPDKLKVRNIRQRLYRGFCAHNDTLPQTIDLFNEKKPQIIALFATNTHLTGASRKRAVRYLEDFYSIINDPKQFKRNITDKCRA